MKLLKPIPKLPSRKQAYKKYNPHTDGVRQSLLLTWLECREKARMQCIEGIESSYISKPLMFGDLSHQCIASCYLTMQKKQLKFWEDAAERTEEWIDTAILFWKDEWVSKGNKVTADVTDLLEESAAMLGALLPGYWKHWWDKDIKETEWIDVEKEFKVALGSSSLITGTIDGVFRNRKTKKRWILETKNKGRWSEDNLIDWLPLDLQCQMYLTADWLTSNEQPAGVRYNVLRRPQERRGKTESLKDFATRIHARAEKEPEHYYFRLDMAMSKAELESAKRRVEFLADAFCDWWDLSHSSCPTLDPMYNSSMCEGKYGTCCYLRHCASGSLEGLKVASR
jgi:hypothetical protein